GQRVRPDVGRVRAGIGQRGRLGAGPLEMEVPGGAAGVEAAAPEPPVVGGARVVEDLVPSPVPIDILGSGGPESLGVAHGPLVDLLVRARHVPSSHSVERAYRVWFRARRLTQTRPPAANKIPTRLASWATRNGPSQELSSRSASMPRRPTE